MPTGYTAIVIEQPDVPFRTFALRCARAFGAAIAQRDDPLTAELVIEHVPSDHYDRALLASEARVAELEELTPEEIAAAAALAWEDEVKRHDASLVKAQQNQRALERLIEAAAQWKPPTDEHEGVQSFMLQQLRETLKWDGREPPPLPPEPTPGEWLERELAQARRDVDYYTKARREEHERCTGRTAWLRAFVDSLPEPAPEEVSK